MTMLFSAGVSYILSNSEEQDKPIRFGQILTNQDIPFKRKTGAGEVKSFQNRTKAGRLFGKEKARKTAWFRAF